MAITNTNRQIKQLALEVADLAGESPAEAIRIALEKRKQRLTVAKAKENRKVNLKEFLKFRGKVKWEGDLDELRRRAPRRTP